jgi:mannose/cellobiose epimerase-like protein (N-acyl-D-glucosamine 2-epimerase family)
VQTSQLADRILDHLFDAKRHYSIDDFSKLYRTQLNILGQPTDDTVQECAVLSRLIYDLSSAYLLTGSERYFLAAKAAVDYQRQAFRMMSHDGQYCFWAYGRRRLQEGERGEHLITASLGPDDMNTMPLYEQIYALAGLTQFYRITLDWEVFEDIRRTIRSFQDFYHDPPEAKEKGFAGQGGYYSHIDPVTMRPDSNSLGENGSQKNWNSVGDHIPAYLVNLILTLDPLPEGTLRPTLEQLRKTCWSILEETSSLIVTKFPDPESDFVNERFHADWSPIHDYRWQQNRAVVGHNLKIAWNLTRVAYYFQTRAKRLRDSGRRQDAEKAEDYESRSKAALSVAQSLGKKMGQVGLDQVRWGVYDCVERKPTNGMPTQFAWDPTKDFWQQEQGILAYLILFGATEDREFLNLARECSAFWNIFFLDRERQGYFFRVTEDGLPILEGEYGRKGGHAIGYHAFELAYLAHVYTRAFASSASGTDNGFCLYFKVLQNAGQTSINVLPDFMPPGRLEIASIRANGVDVTDDRKPTNPNDFQISLDGLKSDCRYGHSASGCINLVVEFRATGG